MMKWIGKTVSPRRRYLIELTEHELKSVCVANLDGLKRTPGLTDKEFNSVESAIKKIRLARCQIPDRVSIKV